MESEIYNIISIKKKQKKQNNLRQLINIFLHYNINKNKFFLWTNGLNWPTAVTKFCCFFIYLQSMTKFIAKRQNLRENSIS